MSVELYNWKFFWWISLPSCNSVLRLCRALCTWIIRIRWFRFQTLNIVIEVYWYGDWFFKYYYSSTKHFTPFCTQYNYLNKLRVIFTVTTANICNCFSERTETRISFILLVLDAVAQLWTFGFVASSRYFGIEAHRLCFGCAYLLHAVWYDQRTSATDDRQCL